MKFFTLLFVAILSAIILIGCDRQLLSPIDPTDPSQTTPQLAQSVLSDLANTAAERGFVDLANAASEVAEVVAMKTETIAEPAPEFLKLALEAMALERAFVKAACGIELRKFAIASVYAAKAHVAEVTGNEEYGRWPLHSLLTYYPAEEPSNMEQALQNLTQAALNAEAALQQLPVENYFIPFAFGYGLRIDAYEDYADYYTWDPHSPLDYVPSLPPKSVEIIDKVRTKYNEAWCRGNFDIIDSTLIEESRLDFFDYAFVRGLADIYAEEVPEDANLIQTNGFSLRPIGITFLTIYFEHSGQTLDEIIEIFRQTVRNRNMGIEPVTIKHSHYP